MGKLVNWLVGAAVVGSLIGLLLPAVQTGHRKSRKLQSASNLRQIGLGLLAYGNQHDSFPPGATSDPAGSPLHGWPTLILPHVDNVELFHMMNLGRPWDDPAETSPPTPSNRALTGTPIPIYRNPGVFDVGDGVDWMLHLGYATNGRVVGPGSPMRPGRIADGAAQTILGGEAGGDYKPWGSPAHWRDLGLGINKAPRGFGGPFDGGANFLFADGAVRFLRDETDMATVRALATPDGGEPPVDRDELE